MKLNYLCIAIAFFIFSCYGQTKNPTISSAEEAANILESQETNPLLSLPQPTIMEAFPFEGHTLDFETEPTPKLQMISKKQNQITDTEKWFDENQLSLPTYTVYNEYQDIQGNIPASIPLNYEGFRITNGFYYETCDIFFYGPNYSDKRFMLITNKTHDKILHFLDFGKFAYAPQNLEEDKAYVFQSINWAVIEDGILYVSHGHDTYAKSSFGKNAYISAIDLENYATIWTTEPLTCNGTFTVVGNAIICGYGFTQEPDYLFVVDRFTGAHRQILDLATGPDYVIQKENQVFVRTYNQDYVFLIER